VGNSAWVSVPGLVNAQHVSALGLDERCLYITIMYDMAHLPYLYSPPSRALTRIRAPLHSPHVLPHGLSSSGYYSDTGI
jgi:hypothetical protein